MVGAYHLVVYSNAYEYDGQMWAGYSFYVMLGFLVLFNFWPVIMEVLDYLQKQVTKFHRKYEPI